MRTIELIRTGTDEQAADSVTTALGHVAFMAWLVEVRDQRDAAIIADHMTANPARREWLRAACVD